MPKVPPYHCSFRAKPRFLTARQGNLSGTTVLLGVRKTAKYWLGFGANDSVNGNWAFTYDYLNRVSTANKNSGQQGFSYGYDQLGNRTSQSVTAGSGGTLSLSYSGNNNRMDGFTYDAAGNLQGDVLHNYSYDAENHLSLPTVLSAPKKRANPETVH